MSEHQLLVVYPGSGTFYQELARRFFTACKEELQEVALCSSRELRSMTADRLGSATLAVVNPVECAATSNDRPGWCAATRSDRLEFFSKLAFGYKRIMVLAEAVESDWYKRQFRVPVAFDALFDIGFVSQKEKHPFPDVSYCFVFDGPTKKEERVIAALSPSKRCIPWALVGYQNPDHLNLVAALVDYGLYPGGFCYLQRPWHMGNPMHRGGQRKAQLGPTGLTAVLSKTSYYVWSSDDHYSTPDDSFAYYESFRFIQALLAGAVPCKIQGKHSLDKPDIPGIFTSAQSFCAKMQEEDYWSMYSSAREFYTSKGSLAEHLEKALRFV